MRKAVNVNSVMKQSIREDKWLHFLYLHYNQHCSDRKQSMISVLQEERTIGGCTVEVQVVH